ncbi:uncharacterized protein LOC114524189 isoform X5 [Dendronephthya gigantea]|uniref:uncharacterized protein LOC114524189 isoform X5 n=1 Tax=Dendronephthya gigantea TaxID=151771 RepID=UPI00106A6B96|nr:uncharacterized protein LOC114524189 isoform X5 [Dendronephthya gigantea]
MTPSDYLFTVRFVVVWFVGSYIFLAHGFPNRGMVGIKAVGRELSRIHEDIGSSRQDSVKDTLPSLANADKIETMYKVISKSMSNGYKVKTTKNCDDEEDCGSAVVDFVEDENTRRPFPVKDKDSVKDTFAVRVLPNSANADNRETLYEIVSKSMSNGHKVKTTKNCDDEEDCGSAVVDFVEDENSRRPFPVKDKDSVKDTFAVRVLPNSANADNRETLYEIVSKSMSNGHKDSVKDTFAVKVFPNSANADNRETLYEIVSKSMSNGHKVKTTKNCDDEEDCGSAVVDFVEDENTRRPFPVKDKDSVKDTFAVRVLPNSANADNRETLYEIVSKSMSNGHKDSVKDTFAVRVLPNSASADNSEKLYEILSKSMSNGHKVETTKNCDDEEDCGSAVVDFVEDENSRRPFPVKDKDSVKDTFAVRVLPNSANADNRETLYEIVSKSMSNGHKVKTTKNCDDEEDCGSAVVDFVEDENRRRPFPVKDKDSVKDTFAVRVLPNSANADNRETLYEIVSKSMSNGHKDSVKDTFAVRVLPNSASADNSEKLYEILSKSMSNGHKVKTTKNCDDEEDCGSAVVDFVEDENTRRPFPVKDKDSVKDTFAVRVLPNSANADNRETLYEIVSKSMSNGHKVKTTKNCDDEEDCGSAVIDFVEDENTRRPFPVKDKDSVKDTFAVRVLPNSANADNRETLYEIVSKSMSNGHKVETTKNCDDEEDCGSAVVDFVEDENSRRPFPVKDKDSVKDTFAVRVLPNSANADNRETLYEIVSKSMSNGHKDSVKDTFAVKVFPNSANADNRETLYEIVSKSMSNGHKVKTTKNCDDEEDCGSAVIDFVEDENTRRPFPVKDKDSVKDTFAVRVLPNSANADNRETLYEIVSKSMSNGHKVKTTKNCDDEEDCGSAVIDFVEDENSRRPFPVKDKDSVKDTFAVRVLPNSANADNRETLYEIVSKSMSNGHKDSVKDTFAVRVLPNSANADNRETLYEIVSKSMSNGHKVETTKHCDDEEDCGSAVVDFVEDENTRRIV